MTDQIHCPRCGMTAKRFYGDWVGDDWWCEPCLPYGFPGKRHEEEPLRLLWEFARDRFAQVDSEWRIWKHEMPFIGSLTGRIT